MNLTLCPFDRAVEADLDVRVDRLRVSDFSSHSNEHEEPNFDLRLTDNDGDPLTVGALGKTVDARDLGFLVLHSPKYWHRRCDTKLAGFLPRRLLRKRVGIIRKLVCLFTTIEFGIDVVHPFSEDVNRLGFHPIADHQTVWTMVLDERWQVRRSFLRSPRCRC